jgi:hypothetical protein
VLVVFPDNILALSTRVLPPELVLGAILGAKLGEKVEVILVRRLGEKTEIVGVQ